MANRLSTEGIHLDLLGLVLQKVRPVFLKLQCRDRHYMLYLYTEVDTERKI